VVIGLYDPATMTRLTPTGGDEAQRLVLGDLEFGTDG
jgi:hypothetical protein